MMAAGALACVDQLRVQPGLIQDRAGNQVVIYDHICLPHTVQPLFRKETGISRPCAHQIDRFAAHQNSQVVSQPLCGCKQCTSHRFRYIIQRHLTVPVFRMHTVPRVHHMHGKPAPLCIQSTVCSAGRVASAAQNSQKFPLRSQFRLSLHGMNGLHDFSQFSLTDLYRQNALPGRRNKLFHRQMLKVQGTIRPCPALPARQL